MADLESLSINDLSEQVYEMRQKQMTQTYIESALAYIDDTTKNSNRIIYPIFNLFNENDLAFTNWSRFPLYNIDFEHGPPERVFIPPGKRRNGMITILPTNHGNNQVEIYIRLDKRFIKDLLNMLK